LFADLPKGSTVILRRTLAYLLAISCCVPLAAHTISLTYAEVQIEEHQVHWLLRVPIPELDLLFALDRNHDGIVDAKELEAGRKQVDEYLLSHVAVIDRGRPLPGSIEGVQTWKDPEGHPFLQVGVRFPSPVVSLNRVTLRCDLLRDVVAAHKTLARIEVAGQTQEFVFENGRTYDAVAKPPWIRSFLQFVRMGAMHIFTGYDHIAFLLGIVLIGGSFPTILKVVTSFTVAHSITLALAALGLVVLPTLVVESGIALSIMYIALENLFFKTFDRRWIVTFFFGLVHGFGFASALAEVHLSGALLATALFSFNLGVEVGQVCIVALLLPGLLYMQHLRLHQLIVRGISVVILALGTFWFWQRITGN